MKKQFTIFIVFLSLWLALTACSSGGASTSLNVNMTDFVFNPNNFTVPAGQEITIEATNNGAVEHELVIFNFGTDAGDKFDDEDEDNIYWEVEVEPGESTTVTFTAPSQPGEYFVSCGIAGHLEAGMVGKLIVVTE